MFHALNGIMGDKPVSYSGDATGSSSITPTASAANAVASGPSTTAPVSLSSNQVTYE